MEAAAAFVVQAQSGAVLYEKSAFEGRPPASLTKMVTALVVVDRCGLDDVATVSARAASATGSVLGLREGETITVGELLKGLMLPSGNDAAVCLAEHVAGSEPAFATLMNEKAAELTAVKTHFVNASGLTAEGHYSCARDLAVFAMAVRLNPYLASIIGQGSAQVTWCGGRTTEVTNLNRLLPRCRGCDGVKTGFTTPAGRCLAASATRDGYSLVSVVLRSPDSWTESGELLNWGFAQPAVGVVEVPAQGAAAPLRFAAPLHQGRLYVPADDFMAALGCPVEMASPTVVATVGGRQLTFSPGVGLTIGDRLADPPIDIVTWRGRAAAAATDLCRLLGLQLRFDKSRLTARVGPRMEASPGQ
jgi:D-alanyl-D-alanine carboxypeptidase